MLTGTDHITDAGATALRDMYVEILSMQPSESGIDDLAILEGKNHMMVMLAAQFLDEDPANQNPDRMDVVNAILDSLIERFGQHKSTKFGHVQVLHTALEHVRNTNLGIKGERPSERLVKQFQDTNVHAFLISYGFIEPDHEKGMPQLTTLGHALLGRVDSALRATTKASIRRPDGQPDSPFGVIDGGKQPETLEFQIMEHG